MLRNFGEESACYHMVRLAFVLMRKVPLIIVLTDTGVVLRKVRWIYVILQMYFSLLRCVSHEQWNSPWIFRSMLPDGGHGHGITAEIYLFKYDSTKLK